MVDPLPVTCDKNEIRRLDKKKVKKRKLKVRMRYT
jgi:hypothetical protein